jgi:hypothetical protein
MRFAEPKKKKPSLAAACSAWSERESSHNKTVFAKTKKIAKKSKPWVLRGQYDNFLIKRNRCLDNTNFPCPE